ncbi:MAG: agmatinase [FCB group bacterium]
MKVLNKKYNFLAIENKYSNLKDSKIVILSAPFENSTSYGKGTSKGPVEILKASAFVEFYDDEFEKELCFDIGIATIEPLDFKNKKSVEAINFVEKEVEKLLEVEKFVVTIGGEHTISIAPIKAFYKKYPSLSILQFDAHSDLRQSYENNKFSHACTLARVGDFFPLDKVTQVGIRALSIQEADLIKNKKVNTFFASSIRRNMYGKNWQKEVVKTFGENVYITFDVDYFDPSIIPSTGTPEPDGFFYSETLDLFREMAIAGKRIIGFDVVELAPIKNLHHPNLTTARLIYKMLNFAFYATSK